MPPFPQTWGSCDIDIRRFVEQLIGLLAVTLSDRLTGVYLHGSLATGSYYRPKSDIDVIVVTNGPHSL